MQRILPNTGVRKPHLRSRQRLSKVCQKHRLHYLAYRDFPRVQGKKPQELHYFSSNQAERCLGAVVQAAVGSGRGAQ